MSRSTFSILPYINRQKVKADGTANILCRITIDGKSAAISTGISCTPQEWNAKKGEVRNARDNGRLASFLAVSCEQAIEINVVVVFYPEIVLRFQWDLSRQIFVA